MEGSHVEIGGEIAKKFRESDLIVNAIWRIMVTASLRVLKLFWYLPLTQYLLPVRVQDAKLWKAT